MAVVLVPGRPNRTAPVRPRLAARWEDYPGHVLCPEFNPTGITVPSGASRPSVIGGPFGPTMKFVAGTPNGMQASSVVTGFPATFVCMIRFSDVTTNQAISSLSNTTSDSHRYQIDVFSGDLRCIFVGTSTTSVSAAVSVGIWHGFVYVARSSTERRLFVNGKDAGTDSTSATHSSTADKAFFGGMANAFFPDGTIFITADMPLAAWFQADIKDSEALALSDEPFSIFRREPALHYWTIAAGGASNAPRYFHRTMHGMS